MRIVNVKVPGTKYSPEPTPTDAPNRGQYYGRIILVAGSTAADLGAEIAEHLSLHLSPYERTIFPNENIFIRLKESMRGQDVYVIQSMATPLHESIFELMILIDTIKRDSAARVTVVVPYLAYGRSDKKDQPRVGIAARMIADMLQTAGADRYMTVDLHSGQIQGFFSIPGDALTAFHLLSDYLVEKAIDNLVVVSTDLGFAKKARNWAEKLDTPLTIIEKRRQSNDSTSEALTVIGDVRDKNVLLVDDEVMTGGSIVNAVNLVKAEGARDVYLAFTHAILAGNAVERLSALGVKEIITTNTVPIPEAKRALLPNMTVLSTAPLLGEVILRANQGRSVGELFHE
jgi:ribose-phosphate pyrophosphokinase